MICIKCDKCKAEINEAFQVRFITRIEKITKQSTISTCNEAISDEIHLCTTCMDNFLSNEWWSK